MNEQPIKRTQEEWDSFFLRFARDVAGMSKDPDRQVGAVVVTPDRRQLSLGYNGFPPEVEDLPSLLADRDFKLANMVHAEVNCLRQAPFPLEGCTLYVTRFPCNRCAERIMASGIYRVVAPAPDFGHARWGTSWRQAAGLMESAGLAITLYKGE